MLRAARPIGLDQRAIAAQVALLVGVEDADERHLGQVETLAQQVDPHQHVEDAEAQVADDLDALEGVDVAVQVAHLDARLAEVVGEVLGHLLGQRGDQAALLRSMRRRIWAIRSSIWPCDSFTSMVGSTRPVGRMICSTTWVARALLVRAGRGADVDDLPDHRVPLGEGQRAIVERRRQPKPVLHQRDLASAIALVHAVDLGHRDVRLVDDDERVVGEEVEQAERALAPPRGR